MKRMSWAAVILALLSFAAGAAWATAPEGLWTTADGLAQVRIAPCGANLCGVIAWLKRPLDKVSGLPRKDDLNPDPALRARPMLGLPLIQNFTPDAPGHWAGGTIYDPDSGRTYQSKMTLRADGDLKVEGCFLIFCKAQIWTPVR
jgi:uncharacterized protein (DUF2147 family)